MPARGAGLHRQARPIRSAGRFAHEAVDVDPATGFLYLTEDNFNFPSGFYRYIAPQNPMQAKRMLDGGGCRCSRSPAQDRRPLSGQTAGATYRSSG